MGAAAPVYQKLTTSLRALFRAEDVPAIQVTDRIARLPGLLDMLKARIGGEVFVLESGATRTWRTGTLPWRKWSDKRDQPAAPIALGPVTD